MLRRKHWNPSYVEDGLAGADSIEDAIQLRKELQHLFSFGGFELRKWKTSEKAVEQSIVKQFRVEESSCTIKYAERFMKALGVEWNAIAYTFRPKVSTACPTGKLTKRLLNSENATSKLVGRASRLYPSHQ